MKITTTIIMIMMIIMIIIVIIVIIVIIIIIIIIIIICARILAQSRVISMPAYLHDKSTVHFQEPLHRLEEGPKIVMANRFDHLTRHYAVECLTATGEDAGRQ